MSTARDVSLPEGLMVLERDATLDALADLVAARLRGALPAALVGVRDVAAYLAVEPSWVYEHAAELGARRLGSGPKARLRFDLRDVDERLASFSVGRESVVTANPAPTPIRRGRRPPGLGASVELLPVRGAGGPG